MGGLAAAAENRGPVKKRRKNSSVKLKASDYVGPPNDMLVKQKKDIRPTVISQSVLTD